MTDRTVLAATVFALTLIGTFVASWLGRRHSKRISAEGLTHQNLNRWWIGLSAGATANSGFVVTGAVGLGYAYGIQWLFLPVAWFLGDIVFWRFFPGRINAAGRVSGATTLSELLTGRHAGNIATATAIVISVIVLACLGGYTAAQWLAGQKFLTGAFGMPDLAALAIFAAVIVAYTAIGGFRGSVYADSFQAVLRIIGTIIALGAVSWFAWNDAEKFHSNLSTVNADFWQVLPGTSVVSFIGFMVGYAAAALGFGLGQPQLISRYMAGASPEETQAAQWIYIGFVQFTWIAMTLFGVILRGVTPNIVDPEAGLSIFFQQNLGPIVTGIIVADVFATIAATSNSLLVAMAQGLTHDLLPRLGWRRKDEFTMVAATLVVGLGTMAASLMLNGTVVTLALSSVSLMGAGLAGAVMVIVMGWKHTPASILASIVFGLVSAIVWKHAGYGAYLNEAAIGIMVSVACNWAVAKTTHSAIRTAPEQL